MNAALDFETVERSAVPESRLPGNADPEVRDARAPGAGFTERRSLSGPLTGAFMAFNFLPTRYFDRSWWQPGALPENLLPHLARNPRSHSHLSRFLLKQMDLEPALHFDYPPEARLLVQMPGERLHRLILLAGVTLMSPSIAGVLRGGERRLVKSELGAEEYGFALRRGRFLLRQARVGDILPVTALADPDTLSTRCRRLGVRALASALCNAPSAVVGRMQLKFPKALVEGDWRPLAQRPGEFLHLFKLLDRQADHP